jgi:mRNA-degrading endonuclease toxin of MazEF toxin-antitoxin module
MTMMPPKLSYKRGDIVLVLFPHSNLRTAKPRPALVVQADDLQTGLPQVIVAMITSKSEIDRVIGTLPMADVERALRYTLNL